MKFRIVLVVIALVLGFSFWQMSRPEIIVVQVAAVELGPVERIVVNTRAGTVKACQRTRLSLPIGGQVEKLYVKNGSKVVASEVLLELWNQDRVAMLNQAQAAYQSAHLEHDRSCVTAKNNMREAKRHQSLLENKLVSSEQADNSLSRAQAAEFACKAAEAREHQAQATVELAKAHLQQTILTAPFAGVVAEVTGEIGEFSTPSPPGVATPPAIDLISDGCHYIEAPIDEVDAFSLQVGQQVRVRIDAIPQQSIPGRLRRIAPYVRDYEKQARTVDVEVDLLDLEGINLLAGYSADVEIVLERRDQVLRIPAEALLQESVTSAATPNYYVLKFNSDQPLQKVPVKVGLRNWQTVQLLSGLSRGDSVVTSIGLPGVTDGALVTAVGVSNSK